VKALLDARGLRSSIDARDIPLGPRVARVHEDCVPIAVVVGPRDRDARRAAIRQGAERRELPLAEAIDAIASACAPPAI
jgi:threonyl-tRNA synthetase